MSSLNTTGRMNRRSDSTMAVTASTMRAILFLSLVFVLAASGAYGQRRLGGGEAIVLEDGTVVSPASITLAAPTANFPGQRADSLLFSWVLRLPIGPAPQGVTTGATAVPGDDRYFLVADTSGTSRWSQIYQNPLFWTLGGNASTTPGTGGNFAGTGDSTAFEIHIDHNGNGTEGRQRVMRFEPANQGPNIIGGFNGNTHVAGVVGATIGGGGADGADNSIDDGRGDFGTISGGVNNTLNGNSTYAAIPGGGGNIASGQYALAMGGLVLSGGNASVAMGSLTRATDNYAVASGLQDTASGQWSVALGEGNRASGDRSVAMGLGALGTGQHGTALGRNVEAGGRWSLAFGDDVTARGNVSMAAGQYVETSSASNSMVLGRGLSDADPLSNSTTRSLFVGFNDLGVSGGNNATLAVVGRNVGVGMTSPDSRLTVQAPSDNGMNGVTPLPTEQLYAIDVRDATTNEIGSHFAILHTPNVGHYNPGVTPVNGGILAFGDPLNPSLNPTFADDTARVMIRGWGTTDQSYALFVHDSGGADALLGVRDDGKMQLKTAIVDDFDGFNFNGDVGPAITGIRNNASGFDLGSCPQRWSDLYIGSNVRMDYNRAGLRFNDAESMLEVRIFDTLIIGTLDVAQTLTNGAYSPPVNAGLYSVSQTYTPGGTGAVDSLDVFFTAFTPGAPITLTLSGGSSPSTSTTITAPAVSAPQYLSFSLRPYNIFSCSEELTWTVTSPETFAVAYEDRTPCVVADENDRARFDFVGDDGWSRTEGVYEGGRADITTAAGGTAPVVQYDTLCGTINDGFGFCRVGGDLCGDSGTVDSSSYIQSPGVQSVNTYPIDYTFRAYRIKQPSAAIAIHAATNRRVRMGTGSGDPQGQLDVQSVTGGVVVPRMTAAQRLLLPAVAGSVVYQTDAPGSGPGAGTTQGMYGYDGSIPGWKKF